MWPSRPVRAGAGVGLVLVLPAIGLAVMSFVSGGFFPDATALATVLVLLVLLVRVTVAREPFAGVSAGVCAAGVVLIGFAMWTLLSARWSGSLSRALLEYNRALLYVAAFVLAGTLARSPARARVLLLALTVAAAGVSVAAVATWLLPEVFPAGGDLSRERLGWPTSYWNATGLIAALALVWCASLACCGRERHWIRVVAAGVAPVAVAALIFTVSRGAVAVAIGGLLVALIAIRSRAIPTGLLALAPGIAAAAVVAVGVEGLNTHTPTEAALARGEWATAMLLGIALGTAALRAALLLADRRLAHVPLPHPGPAVRWGAAGAAVVLLAVAFLAAGGPERARSAADRFASADAQSVGGTLPARQRLIRLGNNGRVDQWRVAFEHGFEPTPLHGSGAGTYPLLWTRYGMSERRVLDTHSLYVEQLGELGVIGAGLLAATLLAIVVALIRRARGPDRAAWGALLAGVLMWAVHAGIDWDWEMPATTAWVFAVGGLALAAPEGEYGEDPDRRARIGVGLACLLFALIPVAVWHSQTRLTDALEALRAGDCVRATRAALDANATLRVRPEPFEVIAYCEGGAGRVRLALEAIDAAVQRDPRNWELHYSRALLRGAAKLDPRPSALAALRLNPSQQITQDAVEGFAGRNARAWRRFALSAPLPLPG
ncbi:MAG TPA: hypothetical protein VK631_01245 [Solirubrobacteraceae bacterium]|nr:hypothetical protein [Solirubrobacteraceae bacterium]